MATSTATVDVGMPRLSDSMEEGTIVAWIKSDGDQVAVGEEIVEIETDKATMAYEAEAAGRLEVVLAEGETVPLGEVIARIHGDGGDGAAGMASQQPAGDGERRRPR